VSKGFKAVALVALSAALSVAAAGCGGSDEESSGTTTGAAAGGGNVTALPASSCSSIY
jgi:hypothetical protein